MINVFKDSFYYLWFSNIPEVVICKALDEIESVGESRVIKSSCRNVYNEWVVLNTVVFLMTFFKGDLLSSIVISDGDEDKTLDLENLNSTGVVATVKRDAIDANITREYYEAKLPDGVAISDFPYGRIKERIDHLKDICTKANSMSFPHGSNIPKKSCRTTYSKPSWRR